ncbi:hypothetical protein JMM81_20720 [Bacillus sp. V3B]|uniref:hypothetical protein n=1 Tax=Bacillus sp. V3B TaxID=2804915 RepID=UPI00210C2133|nr:hypothetical protein [Bacillus sp. V3B]MCQ6277300.1 hypothetical protein [Bacillus sp. V3B]
MSKMSNNYWKNICITNGVPIEGLGHQDIEVLALRSLGLKGTLSDMRYKFYVGRNPQYSFLSDAIAKNDPNIE